MDLENNERFRDLGVQLVSIAVDDIAELKPEVQRLEIQSEFLSDIDGQVSKSYKVPLTYGGEPGHFFALVSREGTVEWAKDYAIPGQNPVMYVDVTEILREVSEHRRQGKATGEPG